MGLMRLVGPVGLFGQVDLVGLLGPVGLVGLVGPSSIAHNLTFLLFFRSFIAQLIFRLVGLNKAALLFDHQYALCS